MAKYTLKSIDRLNDYLEELGFYDINGTQRKGDIAEKVMDIITEVVESVETMVKTKVFDEIKEN